MKSHTIKAIFTNLLFVVGVGLVIFGFIHGSLTVSRILTFDSYPLRSYEETRCDLGIGPTEPLIMPSKETSVSVDASRSSEEYSKKCKERLEHDRKVRKTEDIVTSVATLVAGVVLIFSFKRSIFK